MHARRLLIVCLLVAAGVGAGLAMQRAGTATAPSAPPSRLSVARVPESARTPQDTSFGARMLRLSEDGGYFDTDNLISNERSYLHVAEELRARAGGGAYIGVGPDQNFAYIALLRPDVAYIVDIRRDNALEHLLFKALFERARNRLEYLALLTARRVPDDLAGWDDRPLEDIVTYLEDAPVDEGRYADLAADVRARVVRYGYPVTATDLARIERFHRAFVDAGMGLRFQSHGRAPQWYYPTFAELLLETDRAGVGAGAFRTEQDFRLLKRMQREHRIVPVVGDFAGPHALRAVGEELRATGLPVRAFYASNVEQYLFRQGVFDAFARNLRGLPRTPDAILIRSVFRPRTRNAVAHTLPGYMSAQMVQPIDSLLARMRSGGYRGYLDLVEHAVLSPR